MSTLDTRRPFTRADAIAAGVSPKQLRGSRFRRIFHGVYIESTVADHPLVRAKAALVLHGVGAHVSHLSAARLYGVPPPPQPQEHVTVFAKQERSSRRDIVCHVASPGNRDVRLVEGVPASGPATMFVEVAGLLGLVDLVIVGDSLVRLGITTPHELIDHCRASRDRHAVAARRAAAYVRARVDSPMETAWGCLSCWPGSRSPRSTSRCGTARGGSCSASTCVTPSSS